MARRKKLENTSLEEQLEYVEQEIRTKESDLKELRHKAKEIQKEIEEKQKDELFKALVASGKTIDEVMRFIRQQEKIKSNKKNERCRCGGVNLQRCFFMVS